MSGHSKWSTIKHQKQATDAARGQIFTKLANQITVAVREGGSGDPETNFHLRLAIEKAKVHNLPKENITRAINRALNKSRDLENLQEVVYEGFIPHGVAVLALGVTENRQRTAGFVKNVFEKFGGHLGSSGSTSYMFDKLGLISLVADENDELLSLCIDLDVIDTKKLNSEFLIYTHAKDLHRIRQALVNQGYQVSLCNLIYKAKILNSNLGPELRQRVKDLVTALASLEDINSVYLNVDTSII